MSKNLLKKECVFRTFSKSLVEWLEGYETWKKETRLSRLLYCSKQKGHQKNQIAAEVWILNDLLSFTIRYSSPLAS